jgi:hypothetical protein
MKRLIALLGALALCGCATTTYHPTTAAQAAIRRVDDHVANLVMYEFDRSKPIFEPNEDLIDYFKCCAVAIDSQARQQNPAVSNVASAVSAVRTVGYYPAAQGVALACVAYYSPFTDARDSSLVLQEIAQKIRDGCPRGYPDWWMPRPKSSDQ